MLLGFVSYGLSILFYVLAQRYLGAAKTSAFYAINPFIGCLLSFVLLKETINYSFFIALIFMIIGVFFVNKDKFVIEKKE
ncbi:MAG: EamA family transporter [Bacilli bacterium]|nr:EamA family transporter [Bacilli bacterium]